MLLDQYRTEYPDVEIHAAGIAMMIPDQTQEDPQMDQKIADDSKHRDTDRTSVVIQDASSQDARPPTRLYYMGCWNVGLGPRSDAGGSMASTEIWSMTS